ncbi:MAG: hypothetical protein HQ472_06800 [Ignavibacteria bacterium]|nr:hypothetical protein [Ignavibacteria bacterium]
MPSLITILLVILTTAGCISAAVGTGTQKSGKTTFTTQNVKHRPSVAEAEQTEIELERLKCLSTRVIAEFILTENVKVVCTAEYNSEVSAALHDVYFARLHTLLI